MASEKPHAASDSAATSVERVPRQILFIALDDVPRNTLTAFGASHGLSPHLDSLANDGIVFTNAFTTAPLCTPARYAMLTGRYAANASSITSHRPWNIVGFNTFLTNREPTVAHALKAAGYFTCFVGKYHLGFPLPLHLQTGRSTFSGGGRGLSYTDLANAVRQFGGFDVAPAVFGGNKQTSRSDHNPEWMTQQAVQCVQTARAQKRPVFVYYAPTVPHAPFTLPDTLLRSNVSHTPAGPVVPEATWAAERAAVLSQLTAAGHVCASHTARCAAATSGEAAAASPPPLSSLSRCSREDPDGQMRGQVAGGQTRASTPNLESALALDGCPWIDPSWLRAKENCEQRRLAHLFAASLAWIDRGVGKLLSSVHPRHSLIVLTSDHGASWLGKGSPYEAGVRVPLVVRWRAALPHGRTFSAPLHFSARVTHLDLLPTLLDAVGSRAASERHHGRSMLPALRDDTSYSASTLSSHAAELDARPIFIEVGYARAVRHGGWKLIVINDPHMRCARDDDGSASPTACRNFHGQRIDRMSSPTHQPSASVATNGTSQLTGRRFGLGNMTYDASARHAAFCARRQLYDLTSDALEQTNLVRTRPDKYRELLELLVRHVREVEAGNPAIAKQAGKRTLLGCA